MEENLYGFKMIDLAEPNKFKVYKHNNVEVINIEKFINLFFNNKFSKKEIHNFIFQYNQLLNKNTDDIEYTEIDVTLLENNFVYNPKDVLHTFLSLCYQTYPNGYEHKILKFIDLPLEEDDFGNYFIKIGESSTMFTSHFDSACAKFEKVKLLSFKKDYNLFICSDGNTILSADDKAGVTLMLYMIEHKVPGLYYFFIGEERGGIGSRNLSKNFSKFEYLKDIKRCISFDRRNYSSIITHQSFVRCCSDKFATALCEQFKNLGLEFELDDTGSFTDSANFVDYINECTNISIGYFNEHTGNEHQNVTFLENLCKRCVQIDWENLLVTRTIGYNKQIVERNYDMLLEFKKLKFYSDVKLKAFEDKIFIQLEVVNSSFMENYEDINELNKLFNKWDLNPYISFEEDMDSMLMKFEIL